MKKYIFLFLVSLLNTVPIIAQNQNWINFSKNTNIYSSVIDGNYLWAGSQHGLLKYDMQQDTSFLYTKANSSIPGYMVYGLEIDINGLLWIYIYNLGLFTFDGENWEEINAINDYLDDGTSSNYISDIYIDEDNTKWIAATNGLLALNGSDLIVYNTENSDIPGNHYYSVIKDVESNLWLSGNGFTKYDGYNWETYNHADTNLPMGMFSALQHGNNDDIWSSVGHHLVKINSTGFHTYTSEIEGSFYSYHVEDNNQAIVGMSSGPYYGTTYAYQILEGSNWTPYNSDNSGITNKFASDVIKDNNDNMWFFGNDGLDKLSANGNWSFREISNSKLPDNWIRSIAIGPNGTNYFLTNEGTIGYDWVSWTDVIYLPWTDQITFDNNGNLLLVDPVNLYVYDGLDITTIPNPSPSWLDPTDDVKKIVVDQNNRVWMTHPSYYHEDWGELLAGVFMYDGNEWTNYTTDNSGLPTSEISDICVDAENNIWFATQVGLVKYTNNNWTVYNSSNSPLPYNYVESITMDLSNKLWVLQSNALTSFDGTNWVVQENIPVSLSDICFDSQGNLWGLGLFGISKYNMESWESFDAENSSLPNHNMTCLAVDQHDNVFVGTSLHGLCLFNEDGLDPVLKIEALENRNVNNFTISPNPSSGIINLNFGSQINEKDIYIKTFTIDGKEIYSQKHRYKPYLSLDLKTERKGMYIIQVILQEKTFSEKVLLY